MPEVPAAISQLVETFDRNIEAFKNQKYNEAQLRREFIDPLFEALGWDVTNKAGYAPAYKDVIHEDAIKIGGATKAPQEKTQIPRQIDTTDKEIDRLAYELYGLSDEETAIVEGAVQ